MFTGRPDNRFGILPVTYASRVSYGKGAEHGSLAILEACHHLEYFDIYSGKRPADLGITLLEEVHAHADDACVEKVKHVIKDRHEFVVLLGGDHSTPIGALQAHLEKDSSISVLQLDAHPDLFYSWNNSPYNHRCFGWHASHASSLVQVGVRALDEDELYFAEEHQIKMFYAHKLPELMDIVNALGDKVYISIDVDVFDPSFIRHTGTPEPGGISWDYVIKLLDLVFANKKVVGADIVEFAPDGGEGQFRSESYSLAKLMYAMFGFKSRNT